MSDSAELTDRIVVTGAGGQLGRFLAAEAARRGAQVLALDSSQWDITDPTAAERFISAGDVVVNCAAYTAVDAAETDRERAEAVNVTGPENVAHACARAGAQLIHVSSDYVFSGDQRQPYEPGDATDPLSVYGATKLAGEFAVLAAMPDAHVVRTAWVYTGDGVGADFVSAMRRLAAGDGMVRMVDDQVGSPTYVADLVDALLQVAQGRISEPVLHAANAGAVSRYEQTRAVFELLGADPDRIIAVSSAENPRPAARPAYSALGARVSTAAGLTPLRPWREALAASLA